MIGSLTESLGKCVTPTRTRGSRETLTSVSFISLVKTTSWPQIAQPASLNLPGLVSSQKRGFYHAPVIPAGIRWNPAELFLAGSPAKIAIPGTIYSGRIEPFRNWDWNGPGMDRNGIR